MPAPIPPVLSPYLTSISPRSLIIVTSTLNSPANWLILRWVSAALTSNHQTRGERHLARDEPAKDISGRSVIFVSFLRPLSLWAEIGKKSGLDLTSLALKKRIHYIDGLGISGSSPATAAAPTTTLRSFQLADVQLAIQQAIDENYTAKTENKGEVFSVGDTSVGAKQDPVLVIDGIDFLLALQPEITPQNLSQMLMSIRQRVHTTILGCAADGPLLHNSPSATPLEVDHRAFVTAMAHQSRLIMQLRSLDTGAAKDVSGVIRISRGGSYEDEDEDDAVNGTEAEEGEWLYKVSGDGSVRVWGRGE